MAFCLFQITFMMRHHHFEFSSLLAKDLLHLPAGMTYTRRKLTLSFTSKVINKNIEQ